LKLNKVRLLKERELIGDLIDKILTARSPGCPYSAWGYSFPWQTRTLVVPRGSPNLVCTTFVANALLDAYDEMADERCLKAAGSAADYMVEELFWSEGEINSFNYPLKTSRSRIHNANLLAAAFLCRVSKLTGEKKYLNPAFAAARYSVSKQAPDGSWMYGELPTQQWIDNFHTGYNLAGIRDIGYYGNTGEFADNLRRGFRFYREHFVREDGAPKYFHNRVYPIDVHCVSQSIITLTEFSDVDPRALDMARNVYHWAVTNMRDREGFFYYRILPWCKIRTPYMRWGQAWVLMSLSTLLEAERGQKVEAALAT
jgi:mannose/cellobiose epimerase-like protein (N-acyl-D-glucosamine 2-epimerase family)